MAFEVLGALDQRLDWGAAKDDVEQHFDGDFGNAPQRDFMFALHRGESPAVAG